MARESIHIKLALVQLQVIGAWWFTCSSHWNGVKETSLPARVRSLRCFHCNCVRLFCSTKVLTLFFVPPMHSWVYNRVSALGSRWNHCSSFTLSSLSLFYLMIYFLKSLWQVFYSYGRFLSWLKLLVSAMKFTHSLYWMEIIMCWFIKCTHGLI